MCGTWEWSENARRVRGAGEMRENVRNAGVERERNGEECEDKGDTREREERGSDVRT